MFLLDHAPRSADQLQALAARMQTSATIIYDKFRKPDAEAVDVYVAVSRQIQHLNGCERAGIPEPTLGERDMMHTYASDLLFRNPDADPPASLAPAWAAKAYGIVQIQKFHYQRAHMWRTRLNKAAA